MEATTNESERPAYEAALRRLREASREFHAAAIAVTLAAKRYDPHNVQGADQFTDEVLSEVKSNFNAASRIAPAVGDLCLRGVLGDAAVNAAAAAAVEPAATPNSEAAAPTGN